MFSLRFNPEADLKTYLIGYQSLGFALEKERSEKQLLQSRIEELEYKLINKYNDKETVKSIFNSPDPDSWGAFQDRHPGVSKHILEGMYHDHLRWVNEIKKCNDQLKPEDNAKPI